MMNKHSSRRLLKFLLLVVIAVSSGCGPAVIVPPSTSTPAPSQTPTNIAMPSPTNTPEPFQPQGTLIYSDNNNTYVLDLQNRKTTTVISNEEPGNPEPFLDGDVIYFLQRPQNGTIEQPHQIYKIRIDGTGLEQMTFDSHDKSELSGLPNSNYLAYAESVDTSSIVLFDKNQKSQKVIIQDKKFDFYSPSWSPDGKYIALFKTTKDDPYSSVAIPYGHLVLYSVDDKKIFEPMSDKESPFFKPSWSPDGKSIAFYIGGNVPASIILLNVSKILAGQNTQDGYYTSVSSDNWFPTGSDLNWSPDGKKILFNVFSKDHNFQLVLFQIDSKSLILIPFGQQRMAGFCGLWSPEGSYIAFVTSTGQGPSRSLILNIQNIATEQLVEFEISGKGGADCLSWQDL